MRIQLKDQLRNHALPLKCVYTYTGSALPLELADIPPTIAGLAVTGATVAVTNADGVTVTAPATQVGWHWCVRFAMSNFVTYGFVRRGVRITLTLTDGDGATAEEIVGVGDLDVIATSTTVSPGEPVKGLVHKGDELYLPSEVVDGVQHYKRQEISYDADMGDWGATWTGDYILVDGEYMPYNS